MLPSGKMPMVGDLGPVRLFTVARVLPQNRSMQERMARASCAFVCVTVLPSGNMAKVGDHGAARPFTVAKVLP
jgi:hypothetical protein